MAYRLGFYFLPGPEGQSSTFSYVDIFSLQIIIYHFLFVVNETLF